MGCSFASDTDKCGIYLEDPRLNGFAQLCKFLLAQSTECAVEIAYCFGESGVAPC